MTLERETMEEQLLQRVRMLSPERAREVLDFAEFLLTRQRRQPVRPLRSDQMAALDNSFGIWRDRSDLSGDSAHLVRTLRDEWQTREERLDLGQLPD